MIAWSFLQGALALGVVAAIYLNALNRNMPVDEVRALTFTALVIAIVALILVNRSASASIIKAIRRPNLALAIVLPLVALMLAATLFFPFISALFHFKPLSLNDLILSLGAGFLVLVVLEIIKPLWRRLFPRQSKVAHTKSTKQAI
jgi:Ca2+-transporting ATPase